MHSVNYILAVILSLALSVSSCGTRKTHVEKQVTENSQRTDSVSLLIEKKVSTLRIPPSGVILPIDIPTLQGLPVGASYHASEGQASGRITKEADGTLIFESSCDSLLLLIEEINKEVYHLQSVNTALKATLNEEKTIEVNKLSGWQWFQVWVGRIAVALAAGYVITKKIKRKILPKWQKE
jgi:hypothetical protein